LLRLRRILLSIIVVQTATTYSFPVKTSQSLPFHERTSFETTKGFPSD
jgi:hypothetical protein